MLPIERIQRESRWKKCNRTARRIRTVHRQCGVRYCGSAVGFGSRCLDLVWKKESLELATLWNQHFAHSTDNIRRANIRRMSQMKAGRGGKRASRLIRSTPQ